MPPVGNWQGLESCSERAWEGRLGFASNAAVLPKGENIYIKINTHYFANKWHFLETLVSRGWTAPCCPYERRHYASKFSNRSCQILLIIVAKHAPIEAVLDTRLKNHTPLSSLQKAKYIISSGINPPWRIGDFAGWWDWQKTRMGFQVSQINN